MNLYVPMNKKPNILVYSENQEKINKISELFPENYIIKGVSNKDNCIFLIEEKRFDILIIYLDNPGDMEIEEIEEIPVMAILPEEFAKDEFQSDIIDDVISEPVNRNDFFRKIKILLNLALTQKELEKKHRENIELMTFREDILRIMIHDMGNCISGVVGSLDLLKLQGENLTEKQHKHLVRANESARELLQIIKNINNIAKMEENLLIYKVEKVNINKLTEKIQSNIQSFFIFNKRELIVNINDNPVIAKANGDLLELVMDCLVNNAIKNTPSNGKVFMDISEDRENSYIYIKIKDQGKPLPEHFRKKIFNLYGQLEIYDSGYRVGRGFSTTFCKMAITTMGGQIWMEDPEEEEHTNCFILTLPLYK